MCRNATQEFELDAVIGCNCSTEATFDYLSRICIDTLHKIITRPQSKRQVASDKSPDS